MSTPIRAVLIAKTSSLGRRGVASGIFKQPLYRILHVLYRDTLNTDQLAQLVQLSPLTESWRLLARHRVERHAVEDWSRRLNSPEGAVP